jgi:HAD superfamily hydrolase (TIGR01549 family)
MPAVDTAIVDLDGTLVDSVYQHVLAWRRAFLEVGLDVPASTLHRAIGMGGDRLVTEVAGAGAEAAIGDDVRALHGRHFQEIIGQVTPTEGAEELLHELRRRELHVVVASSGEAEAAERLLSTVGPDEPLRDWVSGDQAESSKPAPDLLDLALEKVGGSTAVVIGDAVWDVRTAQQRDFAAVGLLTGGVSESELREAGAVAVFRNARELAENLDAVLGGLAQSSATSATSPSASRTTA